MHNRVVKLLVMEWTLTQVYGLVSWPGTRTHDTVTTHPLYIS